MHDLKICAASAALLAGAAMLLAGAAQGATRNYIVTDFDSIRVEAPIAVGVQTKRGVTARAEGDAALIGRIDLTVSSRVLIVRLKPSAFEGRSGEEGTARLYLTAPSLRRAQLSGSGTLAIEGMSGQTTQIIASGSGALSAAGIDGDNLTVLQQGSGAMKLTGKARKAIVQLSGSGSIDGTAFTAADIEVTAEGAGAVKALATRSAKVVAVGPASVSVEGNPACTVRHTGSGTVSCGRKEF